MTCVGGTRWCTTLVLAAVCACGGGEGVEPPELTLSRWTGNLPCAGGGDGPADLTLHQVRTNGEPTMYDLVVACPDTTGDRIDVALRGGWTRDTTSNPLGELVGLERDAPLPPLRLLRIAADTLQAWTADGEGLAAYLVRVPAAQ